MPRFSHGVLRIAADLGRKAADNEFSASRCDDLGLMGAYELDHFGLGDFEEDFAMRLRAASERTGLSRRDAGALEAEAWRAWVGSRNRRILERCPKAREYGDD